jgi:hypothetical protein
MFHVAPPTEARSSPDANLLRDLGAATAEFQRLLRPAGNLFSDAVAPERGRSSAIQ